MFCAGGRAAPNLKCGETGTQYMSIGAGLPNWRPSCFLVVVVVVVVVEKSESVSPQGGIPTPRSTLPSTMVVGFGGNH